VLYPNPVHRALCCSVLLCGAGWCYVLFVFGYLISKPLSENLPNDLQIIIQESFVNLHLHVVVCLSDECRVPLMLLVWLSDFDGTVWCSVVPCVALWCSVVIGALWSSVVLCGALWCCVVLCGALWCFVVLCRALWCSVVLCGAMWCPVLLCGAL
jgi:hypothetical protein